jgi:hypothetical protein
VLRPALPALLAPPPVLTLTLVIDVALSFVVTASALWILFFALIIFMMKPGYRRSLFSLHTSTEDCCSYFLDADEDDHEMRSKVFLSHPNKYAQIREEVKE